MDASPSLWSEAFNALTDDKLTLLGLSRPLGAARIESCLTHLLDEIRKKRSLCDEKSWKFDFRGNKVIVRDVAAKIVHWIQRFREIGDVIIQFDPGHAALPWAAIRFLIQTLAANFEQTGIVLVAAETISKSILYGSLYEEFCNRIASSVEGDSKAPDLVELLKRSVRSHYDSIIQTMLVLLQLSSMGSLKRTITSIAKQDQVQEQLEILEKQAEELDRQYQAMSTMHNQTSLQQLVERIRQLGEPINRLAELQKQACTTLEKQELLQVLDWCSTIEFGNHHNFVKERRTPGTGEWLIRHEFLKTWQDSSSSAFLLLYGQPGAGKTFLVSRLIDWSMSRNDPSIGEGSTKESSGEACAYFYCNREEQPRRLAVNILSAFVRQLGLIKFESNEVHADLHSTWFDLRKRSRSLDVRSCRELLSTIMASYTSTTLYVDGLDECEEESRDVLLGELRALADGATRPLKILVSSRPNPEILNPFAEHQRLELEVTDTRDDMLNFIEEQIQSFSRWKSVSPHTIQRVKESMILKSQGMFQWVALQCRQLSRMRVPNETAILQKLDSMPSGLHATYDQMYNEILLSERDEKALALRAISWVLCGYRPLQREWLLSAVCINPLTDDLDQWQIELDEDVLLLLCNNFLAIDKESGMWRLTHLSAAEFLESDPGRVCEAIHTVAEGLLKVFANELRDMFQGHFACCRDGSLRFESADESPTNQMMSSPPRIPKQQSECFCVYLCQTWPFVVMLTQREITVSIRLQHRLFAFFGLEQPSNPGHDVSRGKSYVTPYHFLCKLRYHPLHGMLIWDDSYFDVAPNVTLSWGGWLSTSTPLLDAVFFFGFKKMLGWCLESPHSEVYKSSLVTTKPFPLALGVVFQHEDICHSLLDKMHLTDDHYMSALSFACELRALSLIRRLSSLVMDVNRLVSRVDVIELRLGRQEYGQDNSHLLLLDVMQSENEGSAAEGMKALLQAGADPNLTIPKPRDKYLWNVHESLKDFEYDMDVTAVRLSMLNGFHKITRLLIDSGAELPNEADMWSMRHRISRIDQLFLFPELEKTQRLLDYALVVAATRGWTNEFQCLLDTGANINAVDENQSVLSNLVRLAAQPNAPKYHTDAVFKAVELGADISENNTANRAAMCWAMWGHSVILLKCLMASGGRVLDVFDFRIHTGRSCSEKIRQLLNAGFVVNSLNTEKGPYEPTALMASINASCYACIAVLLEHGADPNLNGNGSFVTPLVIATVSGNLQIIKMLLNAGAETEYEEIYFSPPCGFSSILAFAAFLGNLDVCDVLYQAGVDVNSVSTEARRVRPLAAAICKGFDQICKYLITVGADVEQTSGLDGDSPLVLAILFNRATICRTLIHAGADVNALSGSGPITPLIAAVRFAREDICNILIREGADVDRTCGQRTPLLEAIHKQNPRLSRVLLDAGATANRMFGATYGSYLSDAIMCSMDHETRAAITAMLIERGAAVDAVTKTGPGSALACAALTGDVTICDMLVSAGADTNLIVRGAPFTALWILIESLDDRFTHNRALPWHHTHSNQDWSRFLGQCEAMSFLLERGCELPKPLYNDVTVSLPSLALVPHARSDLSWTVRAAALATTRLKQQRFSLMRKADGWVVWHLAAHNFRILKALMKTWRIPRRQTTFLVRLESLDVHGTILLGTVRFLHGRWHRGFA